MKKAWPTWLTCGEIILLRSICFFVILILIAQLFLFRDGTRIYLSKVDQLEGSTLDSQITPYDGSPVRIKDNIAVITDYQNLLRKGKTLQVKMIAPDKSNFVYLNINGKRTDDFRRGFVEAVVYNGDYVEIDATAIKQHVKFVIRTQGVDMGLLIDGLVLEGEDEIISLGKIKFKNE